MGALGGELEPGGSGCDGSVADEFDQAHDAAVAVGFEEDGFEALAQPTGGVAGGGRGVNTQSGGHAEAAGANKEDEFVADVLGFGAGVDDAGYAGRGAHGGPCLAHEGGVELGEEVAREQWLGLLACAAQCGIEALKSAALQAFQGQVFLARLGADQVPLFH